MLSNLQIRIQNFKSYLDSGWIDLDGKNVLVGIDHRGYSNGSGKSTILDALALFLDNSFESFTKTEVKTLTNLNCPKKQYIIISIKCLLDGEIFEGQISGVDGFVFLGDKFKLNKFQQELTGSIMTQGLVNNIADFDKKSQLDDYIDQFYKVKEIITKIKDFQNSTISKFDESLTKLVSDKTSKQREWDNLNNKKYSLEGQLQAYSSYKDCNLVALQEEKKNLENEKSSLNFNFPLLNNNLSIEKETLKKRLSELDNAKTIGDKIRALETEKQNYINTQNTKFLTFCESKIISVVKGYVSRIQTHYRSAYYEEMNSKKQQREAELSKLVNKINSLKKKSDSYVLTKEEIEGLNKSVKDWCPQEFKLGDTYGEVVKCLNSFYENTRNQLDSDSPELITLQQEYNNYPDLDNNPSLEQVRGMNLDIMIIARKFLSFNISSEFYLIWDYNFESNKLEVEAHLPTSQDFNEVLDYVNIFKNEIKYPKDTVDQALLSYDKRIEELKAKAGENHIKEIEDINARLSGIETESLELSKKEQMLNSVNMKLTNIENTIAWYNKYLEISSEITTIEGTLSSISEELIGYQFKIDTLTKRKGDLTTLVDSISRFAGEELRNEFGYKLAKLSSILLDDIFNIEGTISLESNNTKTTFKYNDGNGFLSFKVLSGGQLQKIKLAINLALLLFFYKDRQYIFLDEVFQHLDTPSKRLLINYLSKNLGIKNILLIQHDSLNFDGFKEIKIFRNEDKNTIVMQNS